MTLVFRKQPSGGRGEYELSGASGGHDAASLNGFEFTLQTPFGDKDTDLVLTNQGGKRRLRRLNPNDPGAIQIGRQAAALLLLPEGTRDEHATSKALPIVLTKRYILDLRVELVEAASGKALLRPTEAIARSAGETDQSHTVKIPLGERFAAIERILAARDRTPGPINTHLDAIAKMLGNANTIQKPLEQEIRQLQGALEGESPVYLPGSDPVPVLANMLGLSGEPDVPNPPETPKDDLSVRVRSESILRARRARGHSATLFRRKVQKAYDYRCFFCGLRAPAPRKGASPGVDAAHILPWGKFDLDIVTNGLILCKQHHWAFDSHLLILGYGSSKYQVSLQLEGTDGYAQDKGTVAELQRVCGVVPDSHLPSKIAERPDPAFIEMLYA